MRYVRLTAILLLLLVGVASAQEWHVEIVDNEVYCGDCNSLAIDRDGYPHISYYAKGVPGGNPALRYARWTGSEWDIQIVDSDGNCGAYTSLALDEDDHPCISYVVYPDMYLRYATWTGSEWDIQLVDEYGSDSTFTSLAFDSEWNPHITYTMGAGINGDLKYASWTGSEWDIQIVDEDNGYNCCWFTSLVLDSNDYPHIVYFGWRGGNNDLMYAHFDGVEWIIETPDDDGNCGAAACITLDSGENPHISYWASGYIKYVYWDGWDWQIQTVDTMYMGGFEFGNTSVVLDGSEYPHITYANNDNTPTLRHTYWTGESWVKEVVDDSPAVFSGVCNSLVLDTDDQPCISYSRYPGSRELVYAWYEEGSGIDLVTLTAKSADDSGVLIFWELDGDTPANLRVLRQAYQNDTLTQNGSVNLSGELAGSATSWLDVSVEAGVEYAYYLQVTELDGTVSRFGPSDIVVPVVVSELALSDPYPNPADESLTIHYELTQNATVKLHIYDVAGRLVETLVSGEQTAGRHSVSWDSSASATGVYLLRLEAEGSVVTKRAVISR